MLSEVLEVSTMLIEGQIRVTVENGQLDERDIQYYIREIESRSRKKN